MSTIFCMHLYFSKYFPRLSDISLPLSVGITGCLLLSNNFTPELLLQFMQLHTQCWLGNITILCSLRKMPEIIHRNNII